MSQWACKEAEADDGWRDKTRRRAAEGEGEESTKEGSRTRQEKVVRNQLGTEVTKERKMQEEEREK